MQGDAFDFRVGIDTGGTFTDIVLTDAASGALHVTKVPSTPENPAVALRTGIEKILADSDQTPEQLSAICHGTTVATNALLQGEIDHLALVVTQGFRHILEIARQAVPDGYGNSYFWVKSERIVPVHRVFEVSERLNFKGHELRPLDEESVRTVARKLRKYRLSTVGVCLIHAYANPAHEQRVPEILLSEYPDLTVSLSSDVWPEYREYERAMTTLVDAFVKPHMRRYLGRIDDELPASLRRKPFLVMQSSGGVLSADQVADKPIATALSGPAAGVIGATAVAKVAGFENVITLDAGGTSTDICLVESSEHRITTGASVGPFPVRLPMIDIRTVGTGGGSIAWIAREGQLQVGPISAGASPGPMCYPGGGDRPAITDANLVLGRIPAELIGGGIALDVDRARAGIADLAQQLGREMAPAELAEAIIEIANWNQANLIRQMTIEQGIDPRDFALLSFGGSGPAQSPAVITLLGLEACIVPPNPGNLSAFGLLMVDYRSDHVFTQVTDEDALDAEKIATVFSGLEEDAAATLAKDGIDAATVKFVRQADVRYTGQSMEIRVTVPAGRMTGESVDAIIENFHTVHERAFGYCYRESQKVELINYSVSGFGNVDKPTLGAALATKSAPPAPLARTVIFDHQPIETPVYQRADLAPGAQISGPLIVEEFGSTTVLFPAQELTVDAYAILIIRASG